MAFVSDANDLVAGTPTRTDRLYVRDLLTDRTLLANGRPSDGPFGARAPTVSDDGRLVAFSGRGTANVGGTPTEVDQVLVADLADGSVVQVPLRPNGNAPDSDSATPFLRADGTEVVFASERDRPRRSADAGRVVAVRGADRRTSERRLGPDVAAEPLRSDDAGPGARHP